MSESDATPSGEEQQTRVGHCKADSTDVYAGRGAGGCHIKNTEIGERGWLGNPYPLDAYSRDESVSKFKTVFVRRLRASAEFREAVADLAGEDLGCWCQRLDEDEPRCHAEIIARYADQLATSDPTDVLGGDVIDAE